MERISMNNNYDIIVIGGGHAGIEAAFIAAKLNKIVALISLDKNNLAALPCNPSIGGPAKGIITREIDALGGVQGIFADENAIQVKMLNTSKGLAVRAIRVQIDKDKYTKHVAKEVSKNPNIDLIEGLAIKILNDNKKITGVELEDKTILNSKAIILTTGTYLDARILRGSISKISGPNGQRTSNLLSESIASLGHKLIRLKTGTPPRVFSDSINFDEVEKEILKPESLNFSFKNKNKITEQTSCYLTYTNAKTHKIILDNLKKSSMYSGLINGVGPRYCPSVEDKIVRFQNKKRHQIFFEPLTSKAKIMYINGLSTSMPIDIQEKFLKTIPGLKNAKVKNWGYAIEYDAIDPLQLNKSLESNLIKRLYFAGQINGTSGYEEAAGQGLVAGINAVQKLNNKPSLNLLRSDSYIGVLIDDLVTKGTQEPYRMLTSRAEYRLLLRNDNADIRLLKYAKSINSLSQEDIDYVEKKYSLINKKIKELETNYVSSNSKLAQIYNIKNGPSYIQVLARPDVDPAHVIPHFPHKEELVSQVRLKGYIKKQNIAADKMKRLEKLKLPTDIDYDKVQNLANEAREKFIKIRPRTIGQASRISGINPADIQMLMFYLNVRKNT